MNEICVVRPNHLTEGEVSEGEKREQMFSNLTMKSCKRLNRHTRGVFIVIYIIHSHTQNKK